VEAEAEAEAEPEPEPEVTAGTESEREQLLPAGCTVQVHGLKGAPQHNGKHGRVLRFDAVKGRYQVELASEPAVHGNLRQLRRCARLRRLQGDAAFRLWDVHACVAARAVRLAGESN
jgi:hypothetical protein